MVLRDQASARDVFFGNSSSYTGGSLPAILGNTVSLETFKYFTCLLASRVFSVEYRRKEFEYLIPVADMMNHSEQPNAQRSGGLSCRIHFLQKLSI
jgi:hypothetical protein